MTINKPLLRSTLELIKANPDHWDQEYWHCKTSHCFAGFVDLQLRKLPLDTDENSIPYKDIRVLLEEAGFNLKDKGLTKAIKNLDYPEDPTPGEIAQLALGLSLSQSVSLFNTTNTLEDLEQKVNYLCSL